MFNKEYIDRFLFGKSIDVKLDLYQTSHFIDDLDVDICNEIFEKSFSKKFATKLIIVYYFRYYVNFIYIKENKLVCRSLNRKEFIESYRNLRIEKITNHCI